MPPSIHILFYIIIPLSIINDTSKIISAFELNRVNNRVVGRASTNHYRDCRPFSPITWSTHNGLRKSVISLKSDLVNNSNSSVEESAEPEDTVPRSKSISLADFDPRKTAKTQQDEQEAEAAKKERYLNWLSSGVRYLKETDDSDDSTTNNSDNNYSSTSTSYHAGSSGAARHEGRYSASDWFHNAITLRSSTVLDEIRSPVLAVTTWGAIVSIVYKILLLTKRQKIASAMCINPQPHTLMVSSLSLLLVFRTNSAYQRFAEGRKIWEQILSYARDLSRFMALYEKEITTEKRRRVQRLLAAFPYLLRHRIRPNYASMRRLKDSPEERDPENSILLYDDSALLDNDTAAAEVATDEESKGMSRRKMRELFYVDKRTLPWKLLEGETLIACTKAQNRPLWVCDRMGKELVSTPDQPNFTNRERLLLLSLVDKLSHCIGECERIHQTVVPLNYARHCLRSLTFWLFSLPFALVDKLGLLTGPVLFMLSWLLYGIYQIGYNIEDPFQSTLRLSILSDAIRRDVFANEMRDTAFVLEDFMDTKEEEEDDDEDVKLESESDEYEQEQMDEGEVLFNIVESKIHQEDVLLHHQATASSSKNGFVDCNLQQNDADVSSSSGGVYNIPNKSAYE